MSTPEGTPADLQARIAAALADADYDTALLADCEQTWDHLDGTE